MSFTQIQGIVGSVSLNPTSPTSYTMASNPTTGNCVIISFGFLNLSIGETYSISSVKDSNNNVYTVSASSPSYTETGALAGPVYIAYLLSAPSNATKTITITWTSSVQPYYLYFYADEFSYSGTLSFDTDIVGQSASATGVSTPTIAPAGNGELLYAGALSSSGTMYAVSGGWTQGGGGSWSGNSYFRSEYILSSTGSTAVAITASTSGVYNSIAAAFKTTTTTSIPGLLAALGCGTT